MVDSVLKRPLKIMKFSRKNLGGASHRDCYNAYVSCFRGYLHVKFHHGMKLVPRRNHPCPWWNVSYCLHVSPRWNFILGWTHPCQKDRQEISSRDENKKKRRVNTSSRNEILKWACFDGFIQICFRNLTCLNIMKHKASL